MAARVEFTKDTLTPGLKGLDGTMKRNIYQVLRFHEPKISSRAKSNAPWTDRTGNARNGLSATTRKESENVYALILYHTVSYGIWLEVARAGKYAIIMPTIYAQIPEIVASLQRLLERVQLA